MLVFDACTDRAFDGWMKQTLRGKFKHPSVPQERSLVSIGEFNKVPRRVIRLTLCWFSKLALDTIRIGPGQACGRPERSIKN